MKLNSPFGIFILTLYVALHAANGILMKAMALNGVTTADALILRGIGCIGLALIIGKAIGSRLWPQNLGLQAFRFLFSGLALWALMAAYQYCNATSVAVISRLDNALLVIAGPAIGVRAGKLQRALAVLCCLLLLGVAMGGGIGPGESLKGHRRGAPPMAQSKQCDRPQPGDGLRSACRSPISAADRICGTSGRRGSRRSRSCRAPSGPG